MTSPNVTPAADLDAVRAVVIGGSGEKGDVVSGGARESSSAKVFGENRLNENV